METLNPFKNRNAITEPDDFFGRTRELRDLYQRVLQGMCVSLVGERRVGKSSLMNALGFERDVYSVSDAVRFVMLDMQELADCDEAALIERLLDLVEDETNVRQAGNDRTGLEATVKQLVSTGQRPVFLIDEFNHLSHNPRISPGFFSFLRSIAARWCVPFVIAYREGTVEDLVGGLSEFDGLSPFMNIFSVAYIGPFDRADADELIMSPAADAGVQFSPADAERIRGLAGQLPFFLQIACYHAFEAKRQGTLDASWESVEAQFRVEAAHHFHHLLGRLSPDERLLLRARQRRDGDQLNPAAQQRARERLRQKGILVPGTQDDRIFSTLFEELANAADGMTA